MDKNKYNPPEEIVEPDLSGMDTAEDMIRDAAKMGILERVRELLRIPVIGCDDGLAQLARDIAYEFASSDNRDLAVDLFIHVTGIGEYGPSSLRKYAERHGCSHECFRRKADAMRQRLCLPARGTQPEPFPDAA